MTGRRDRRGGRSASGLTLTQKFRSLLASKGRFAFEARSNTNDGTNVLTFVDLIDPTRILTVTGTLARPVVDAAFGGALTCTTNGTQSALCNKPAPNFRFLSDGTGMELRNIWLTTSLSVQVPISTRTTGTGISIVVIPPATGALYVGAAALTVINSLAALNPANTALSMHSRYSSALSPVATQHNTGQTDATQASETSPPDPGDPQNTLRLFSDGTNHWSGRWFGSYGFLPLTSQERSLVDAYTTLVSGLATP